MHTPLAVLAARHRAGCCRRVERKRGGHCEGRTRGSLVGMSVMIFRAVALLLRLECFIRPRSTLVGRLSLQALRVVCQPPFGRDGGKAKVSIFVHEARRNKKISMRVLVPFLIYPGEKQRAKMTWICLLGVCEVWVPFLFVWGAAGHFF